MPYYSIEYDLKAGQNYKPIIGAIEELGGVRALDSYWLIELSDADAEPVRDHFKQFLPTPDTDKLMVIEFSKRPRFTRAFKAALEWIQARFP